MNRHTVWAWGAFAMRRPQPGPLALTVLAGMGGIGKTVLAHALTRDRAVQDAVEVSFKALAPEMEERYND